MPVLERRLKGQVDLLTDDALFAACGVRVAFTARSGGVSQGPFASLNTAGHVEDDSVHVRQNRKIALQAIGFPGVPLIVPNQVHGTHVVQVEGPDDVARAKEEAAEGADAVLVCAPDVAALMNFADCLPLIVVSPTGRFVVAHAGWRGALAGVAGTAVRALLQAEADAADGDGPDASRYNAYIGPHIRLECFQVGEDIAARFAERFGDDAIADDRHVNLAHAVTVDLTQAGMSADRIADARLCTVCNADRYFSYRASGGTCGRHAAIAVATAGTTP